MDPSPWAWTCPSPSISRLKHRLLSAWKYQPMLVSSIFPFCLFLPFPKPHHGSPATFKDTPSHLGLALVSLLGSKGVPPAPSHLPVGCIPAPPAHGVPQGGLGHGTSQRVKLLPKHRKPAAKARFPGRKHAVYCGRKGKRSVNAIARAEVIGVSCCKLPE